VPLPRLAVTDAHSWASALLAGGFLAVLLVPIFISIINLATYFIRPEAVERAPPSYRRGVLASTSL
jgi:hypothetical protein